MWFCKGFQRDGTDLLKGKTRLLDPPMVAYVYPGHPKFYISSHPVPVMPYAILMHTNFQKNNPCLQNI
jgi:hypothetical protein